MAFDLDKQVIQVMNIFSPIKARSIIICVILSPWNALQIKAWDKTNLHHRSLATEHRTSTWQSTDPSPILTKRLWGRKDRTCTSAGRVEADGGAAGVEEKGGTVRLEGAPPCFLLCCWSGRGGGRLRRRRGGGQSPPAGMRAAPTKAPPMSQVLQVYNWHSPWLKTVYIEYFNWKHEGNLFQI